ncbi:MAG: hypothetical protein K2X81_20235, partial [Candidatus Obscuribacterales bacterium]|nr:hypothetical protein [Candidatus Obscuribacterales bacterium]
LPQSKIMQETLQQLKVVSTDMDIHVEKENTQVHPLLKKLFAATDAVTHNCTGKEENAHA